MTETNHLELKQTESIKLADPGLGVGTVENIKVKFSVRIAIHSGKGRQEDQKFKPSLSNSVT